MENSISVTNDAFSIRERAKPRGNKMLEFTAAAWVIVAVVGQWIFAAYLALFYGGTALRGNLEAWGQGGPHGIIEGDPIGNVAMAIHVFVAIIIMGGGPLQLIPQIRTRVPKFHRVTGKVYLVTSVLVAMAGVYMIWTRGTVGGVILHVANTIDAALIAIFGLLAWRTAVARNFKTHRKWTLRLFMVVSAVWFYRIGLMFWLGVNKGPVGMDLETFTGPFLTFLAFAQYMLPLAILELYFYARESKNSVGKIAMSAGLILATFVTGLGIFIATVGMWLPKI